MISGYASVGLYVDMYYVGFYGWWLFDDYK